MSRFIEECRKEWARLGVPDAEANEMATDLEADLCEAAAEGAAPEEVLGNGYFDAKSFAASWALARGVVPEPSRQGRSVTIRSLALGLGALVGVVIAAVGFLILVRPRFGSRSVAIAHAAPFVRPVPAILINPHQFFAGSSSALDPFGWVLLAVGLVGITVILLVWRPWTMVRRRAGFDTNAGMRSYL
jgi:hypothetical protein